jgi:hypothetical protein
LSFVVAVSIRIEMFFAFIPNCVLWGLTTLAGMLIIMWLESSMLLWNDFRAFNVARKEFVYTRFRMSDTERKE